MLVKKSIECVVDNWNDKMWVEFSFVVYNYVNQAFIDTFIHGRLFWTLVVCLFLPWAFFVAFNIAFHQYWKWPFCFSHIPTADARWVSYVYITCVTDWSDVTFYPFPIFFLSVILENPAVIFFSWMSAGVNQCSPRGCSQQGQLSFCLPEQNKQICLLTWALAKINFIGNSAT